MACRITSHTDNEIETSVVKGVYLDPILTNQTAEETIAKIRNIQNRFTLMEVPNEKLPKGHYLNDTGKTMRYTLISNTDVIIPRRATDANKEAFVSRKGIEEAKKIAENPNNKNKAEIGTKLHGVAEQLLSMIVEQSKGSVITDKKPEITLEELKKNSGLNEEDFRNLVKELQSLYKIISDTQKSIDSNKNAQLFPEMFLLQIEKKGLVGRTLDVVAIYSDNTASHFDFKFKSPGADKKTVDSLTGRKEISKFDWISSYDMQDYIRQIGDSAEVLKKQYGVKGMRHNRVIPAHFEFNSNTGKITQLSIGEGMNKYLTQIPIGLEFTENKVKEQTVTSLTNIKNNVEQQLKNEVKQEKRFLLQDRIKKLQESIKLVQVNDDISGVLQLYRTIVDKYTDEIGKIKVNLKDQLINDSLNAYYISDKDLVQLYQELAIIREIVDNPEWYSSMTDKLSETRIQDINTLRLLLNNKLGFMISNLKEEMVERTLSKSELDQLEDTIDLGMMEKWFQTFGSIDHPIFKKTKNLIDNSNNKTRLELQDFYEDLKKQTLALQDSQGKKGYKTFNILVNEKTGNLHSMYNSEFHEMIKKAREDKDLEVLKKYLVLKSNAQEIYENLKEKVRLSNTEERFKQWLKDNPNVESMLTSPKYYIYYEYSNNAKEYYTEGYKNIEKSPEALSYYNFWTKSMKKFKEMLDIESYQQLPPNFIPWIKASLLEQVVNGDYGTKEVLKNMKDLFNVHEASQTFGQLSGEIDLKTGDKLHEVPRYFINPLLDSENNINQNEKSMDLSKSMMIFAGMAMNYSNMKEVEGTVLALKEVLATTQVLKTDDKGNFVKNLLGSKAKIVNPEIDTLFNDMVNYHLYGVKLKGEQRKLIEIARKTKNYTQMYQLAFAPMTMLGSYTSSTMSRWMEAGKGYYFTNKQMVQARKQLIGMVGDKSITVFSDKDKIEIARACAGFFEPHQGKQTHLKAQDITANKLIGNWLENAMFWGYRKGDELQDNAVLIAMMQNYGIDENGNIKRLANLPEGTKSLLDSATIKDGKINIQGIVEDGKVNLEKYTIFRNMVMFVNKGIKGSMNEEDMNAINMNLLGNMMMSFKNWIPGLAEERFAGIKYNQNTKAVTIGRWRAFTSDVASKEEVGFIRLVLSGLGKASLAVADGITFNKFGIYKINDQRTRILFEDFKQKNLNNSDIQEMSYEDFVDYKKGQVRAFAREAAIILALMGSVALFAADWDDDEEPDYKKYYATRFVFRLLNRTRRELSFFFNPTEILTTAGTNVIPQIGLINDLQKTIGNTYDETRDLTFGENSERDQSPIGYRSLKLLPGYKAISSLFEPFEQDEENKY